MSIHPPEKIMKVAAGHSMVVSADRLTNGHVRIQTALEYGDGSSIDVFVVNQTEINAVLLTDFGNTMNWLMDAGVKPTATKRRQAFVRRVLEQFDIENRSGALELRVPTLNDVPAGVLRLSQACMRIADMVLTAKMRLPTAFGERVAEVFEEGDLQYEENVALPGRLGSVTVDYLVHGARAKSAVLTWSSGSPGGAHTRANEVLARWVDLRESGENRVTVYDDERDIFRNEDITRLEEFSDVIPASDRDRVRDAVAA